MPRRTRFLSRIVVAAALGLGSGSAWADHIDLFDAGPFTLSTSASSASLTVVGIPVASAIGGERFVGISGNTGTATVSLGPVLNPGANDDSVVFAATASALLTIRLGNLSPLHENFLDMPGGAARWDRLRVDFGTGSSASTAVTLQLLGFNGNSLSLTQSYAGGAGALEFFYGEFPPGGVAFIQDVLRDVASAQLTVAAPTGGGTYFLADAIRRGSVAVAEPSSVALLVLGFFACARSRRKRA